MSSRISILKPSGVVTKAWSSRPGAPATIGTPAAFHFAIASCVFGTMKPTWFTTVPTVPPVFGGVPGAWCRNTATPGKRTISNAPGLIAVPPMATRIFLFASTSRELRCQWPMVTPTSLGG